MRSLVRDYFLVHCPTPQDLWCLFNYNGLSKKKDKNHRFIKTEAQQIHQKEIMKYRYQQLKIKKT